jgi:phosphatidylglycerol---prolipoprotein diacylglyceryl transferase
MMIYPEINPVAFYIPMIDWPVYWYGLMYLIGFALGWGALSLRLRYMNAPPFTQEQLGDIVFYTALGVIIGGRVGYMLFYDPRAFIANPLLLFQTWKGGMSFHGGLIGVLFAFLFYMRKVKKPLLMLTDFIAPVVPIGLGTGRIGNFINGELWGRMTDVSWGMIFPQAGPLPRHPSQLYEACFEGLILFLILWFYSQKPRPIGAVSGVFALFYGLFRFSIEFFREPDADIGYIAWGWLTEGQLLSIPLVFIGLILILGEKLRRGDRRSP